MSDRASVAVSRTLAAGVACSLTLMGAGLVAALARGGVPDAATPLASLPAAVLAGDPGGLMSLGLIILLATPAARVCVLIWQFARRDEWRFVAVSAVVLGVLVASVLIGRGE